MDVTLRFTKSWLEPPDVGWLCTFTRTKKVENCRKEQCNCCKFSPCMLTSISFPVVSCHSVQCSMNHLYNCLFFFSVSLVGAHCSLRSFNLWLWGLSLTVGDVESWKVVFVFVDFQIQDESSSWNKNTIFSPFRPSLNLCFSSWGGCRGGGFFVGRSGFGFGFSRGFRSFGGSLLLAWMALL